MEKILIVKTGETTPEILSQRGDFEDWIISGMGVEPGTVSVVDVVRGEDFPDYDAVSGVVITGSHDMVTDHLEWSERTAKWLPGAVDRRIPILGICYGHQLLAHAMGGVVENNPRGLEFGNTAVTLTGAARTDPLFKGFPSPLGVHASHTQTVRKLPEGAIHLASNAMDANHAFRIGECARGIQFHPEFDADIMIRYINTFREMLT
ncbi:MAG: glutamine amidotransferase, partial [Desulfobacterales bacterium]|nr:glutamine amidotransferase [Desulfobacterales bacterium]